MRPFTFACVFGFCAGMDSTMFVFTCVGQSDVVSRFIVTVSVLSMMVMVTCFLKVRRDGFIGG